MSHDDENFRDVAWTVSVLQQDKVKSEYNTDYTYLGTYRTLHMAHDKLAIQMRKYMGWPDESIAPWQYMSQCSPSRTDGYSSAVFIAEEEDDEPTEEDDYYIKKRKAGFWFKITCIIIEEPPKKEQARKKRKKRQSSN